MRKITAGLFISLDGVTESPNLWQFDYFDAGVADEMNKYIQEEDTVVLGRVTYQDWAPYWPDSSDEPYASHINNVPKFVVSSTLERVEWGRWGNINLIKGDLAKELSRLKQRPGKNIGIGGSPTLVRSLIQNDLLDELTLMIHPVLVGRGKRLFEGESDLKKLQLVNSVITGSGVAVLTYRMAEK